jgi:hypothetical protein
MGTKDVKDSIVLKKLQVDIYKKLKVCKLSLTLAQLRPCLSYISNELLTPIVCIPGVLSTLYLMLYSGGERAVLHSSE